MIPAPEEQPVSAYAYFDDDGRWCCDIRVKGKAKPDGDVDGAAISYAYLRITGYLLGSDRMDEKLETQHAEDGFFLIDIVIDRKGAEAPSRAIIQFYNDESGHIVLLDDKEVGSDRQQEIDESHSGFNDLYEPTIVAESTISLPVFLAAMKAGADVVKACKLAILAAYSGMEAGTQDAHHLFDHAIGYLQNLRQTGIIATTAADANVIGPNFADAGKLIPPILANAAAAWVGAALEAEVRDDDVIALLSIEKTLEHTYLQAPTGHGRLATVEALDGLKVHLDKLVALAQEDAPWTHAGLVTRYFGRPSDHSR